AASVGLRTPVAAALVLAFGIATLMNNSLASTPKATAFPEPTLVKTNGIRLAVYEQGEGFPVVLCHGFPELAYSWRHQLPALAEAGFHAIAPDQRGYGASDRPDAVDAYSIDHLCDDLIGL